MVAQHSQPCDRSRGRAGVALSGRRMGVDHRAVGGGSHRSNDRRDTQDATRKANRHVGPRRRDSRRRHPAEAGLEAAEQWQTARLPTTNPTYFQHGVLTFIRFYSETLLSSWLVG